MKTLLIILAICLLSCSNPIIEKKTYSLTTEQILVIYMNGYKKGENNISSFTYNWDGIMKENTNRKNFLQDNMDYGEIELIKHNWEKAGLTTKLTSY